MRRLVPLEVALFVAACVIPLPIPAAVPLLVVASASLWLRGHSWAAVSKGPALNAAIGGAAGTLALVLAVVAGAPAIERITDYAVQWSTYPVVRGNVSTFALVAVVVGASAAASELVLRGWIVERALELGAHRAIAVVVGAIADALVTDGDIAMRIGAGVFGVGLGWMYVAGGRSVLGPICARLAFSLGALALEAMRVVG